MAGVTIKSSHVGTNLKTHYVYDRTGTCRPISTQAYYVEELKQDFLAGRGLTNADYRVILDKHDLIAGIYPVGDDGTIDTANSFPYISVHSGGLFYFRKEQIMLRDMQDFRDMQDYRGIIYGIKDLVIVRTKIFAKQFHSQSDWTSYNLTDSILMRNVLLA